MTQLCLGTAQFGMDYGVRGQRQPALPDAVEMLDYATQHGVCAIDTAEMYGNAEEVVGAFLMKKTLPRGNIAVMSKFPPNLLDEIPESGYLAVLKEHVEHTLETLHTDYLDAYLLHSARYVYNDAILAALAELQKRGYTKHAGVSVYEVDEAKAGLQKQTVGIMQLPFSVFDQRMAEQGVFAGTAGGDTIIDSRSVFVQGLLMMEEDEVPAFLAKARPILRRLDAVCTQHGVSRLSVAISFVQLQSAINRVVIGVDNLQQLQEDIHLFNNPLPQATMAEIAREFSGLEAEIVMPSLWHKE